MIDKSLISLLSEPTTIILGFAAFIVVNFTRLRGMFNLTTKKYRHREQFRKNLELSKLYFEVEELRQNNNIDKSELDQIINGGTVNTEENATVEVTAFDPNSIKSKRKLKLHIKELESKLETMPDPLEESIEIVAFGIPAFVILGLGLLSLIDPFTGKAPIPTIIDIVSFFIGGFFFFGLWGSIASSATISIFPWLDDAKPIVQKLITTLVVLVLPIVAGLGISFFVLTAEFFGQNDEKHEIPSEIAGPME